MFLFKHANPKGDGMEMVAVGVAIMFIFLPLSLPAYSLAKPRALSHPRGPSRADRVVLSISACGCKFLDELSIQPAPWNAG